jgi:hypothetical protein
LGLASLKKSLRTPDLTGFRISFYSGKVSRSIGYVAIQVDKIRVNFKVKIGEIEKRNLRVDKIRPSTSL